MKINNPLARWLRRKGFRPDDPLSPAVARDWLVSLGTALGVVLLGLVALGVWRWWVAQLDQEIRARATATPALQVDQRQVKTVIDAIEKRESERNQLKGTPLPAIDPSR